MNNAEIIELTHQHMVDVYGCLPLAFARGHGAYLYDADGNRYLDFFCGLAVTSLGHGNPRVVRAHKGQGEKLTTVSKVFTAAPRRGARRARGGISRGFSPWCPASDSCRSTISGRSIARDATKLSA